MTVKKVGALVSEGAALLLTFACRTKKKEKDFSGTGRESRARRRRTGGRLHRRIFLFKDTTVLCRRIVGELVDLGSNKPTEIEDGGEEGLVRPHTSKKK